MNVTPSKTYNYALTGAIAVTSLQLWFSRYQAKAPYGKYGGKPAAGVSLDPRFGWWLMELPATLSFLYHFYQGRKNKKARGPEAENEGPSGLTPKVLLLLWCIHYANRGWYFPLTIRVAQGGAQSFALFNSAIGAFFLFVHGYLNGRMFSEFGTKYTDAWLRDPRFLAGLALYETGFIITVHSESIMRNLRPAGEVITAANRYKIPYGGMFEYVTNAAYFGELVAWSGMCVLTWSPSVLPVLLISCANLVPRALEQQKWYLKKFPDYPKNRKALIPFIL